MIWSHEGCVFRAKDTGEPGWAMSVARDPATGNWVGWLCRGEFELWRTETRKLELCLVRTEEIFARRQTLPDPNVEKTCRTCGSWNRAVADWGHCHRDRDRALLCPGSWGCRRHGS